MLLDYTVTTPDGGADLPVPYDLHAEEAVLGSLLQDRDAVIGAATFLQPGHFYREANGWIYAAILDLYHRREPADLVTLGQELARTHLLDNVGGYAYLAALMHGVPTAVHIEYYGRIVHRLARRRRAITIGGKIAGLGYATELDDAAWEAAIHREYQALHTDEPAHGVPLTTALYSYLERLEARQQGQLPPGISTGFPVLDEAGVYFDAGTINLLIGVTSGGKTAAALQLIRQIAAQGKAIVILSLEMDSDALCQRLLSGATSIEMRVFREAALGATMWDRVGDAANALTQAGHVTLIDEGITTMDALQVEVQRLQADKAAGCDLLIVDYLQLLDAGRRTGNREEAVSSVSRGLKRLARQCNCAVLALSQINNAAEDRGQPSLRDVRESGAPTHDASVALYLHRPDPNQPAWINWHVLKNREGERNTIVPMRWEGAVQQFREMTDQEIRAAQYDKDRRGA